MGLREEHWTLWRLGGSRVVGDGGQERAEGRKHCEPRGWELCLLGGGRWMLAALNPDTYSHRQEGDMDNSRITCQGFDNITQTLVM